jgi:hypothetical protein
MDPNSSLPIEVASRIHQALKFVEIATKKVDEALREADIDRDQALRELNRAMWEADAAFTTLGQYLAR